MKPTKHLCQSCHCLVDEGSNFCSVCGQKKITKPLSFKELVGDFFSNLFSLDSKFFRTYGGLIFSPGKLTREYTKGRRQLYYTPIRLFLFGLTIAFILLNFVLADLQKFGQDMDKNVQIELYKDSLRTQFFLAFPDSTDHQMIDSLLDQNNILKGLGNSFLSFGSDDNILMEDLYKLDGEEIINKYNIRGFFQKQFVIQLSKAIKTPGNFQIYLLSHISWIILVSIPFIALLLKLLYIRRERTYIEHIVYALHLHTFIFMACTILFIYLLINNNHLLGPILYTLIVIGVYFILSLKNAYQQSAIKTSFKVILFLLFYPLIITIALSIFLVINFFAF